MNAAQVARIGDAVDEICDDLDRILGRVIAVDPVLRIVREQEGLPTWLTRWSVENVVTGERMFPWTPDRGVALRFGLAFVERNPGASLDETFGDFSGAFSVRVSTVEESNVVPIRGGA